MFRWQREKESREQNAGPPCGQVRVLVVGDSGVGKTSLVHLILKGSSIARPPQTFGCAVGVKHVSYGNPSSSSSSITQGDFFVELWDISGHERYKDCRPLFYVQINGVIFVHDLTQRNTKTNMMKWASEIASTGTFSATLGSGGPGGLPVPYLIIGNKSDIAAKVGTRVSSGNLVDVARQWVEKQGLLPSSEELPLTESFPGSSALSAAAKEARYDKEAINKFFRMLIRRRYFSGELPMSSPWSSVAILNSVPNTSENSSEDAPQFHRRLSVNSEGYKYNQLHQLPVQRILIPPLTVSSHQPTSAHENYSSKRLSASLSPDTDSTKYRTNINA